MDNAQPRRGQSLIAVLAIALAAVAGATLLRLAMDPWLGSTAVFMPYLLGVLCATWFAGLRPGIIAAVLGVLAGWYFFIGTPFTFDMWVPGTGMRVLTSGVTGVLIAVIGGRMHSARAEAEKQAKNAHAELSERKQVEKLLGHTAADLDRERRLYDAVIGSTPDLVYVFDLNYRFTFVNKALLEMWGRTLEDSLGKSLLEIGYEPWHAEMHEREIDQVVATKQSIRGEVPFPHATLGTRIYDYIFVPVFNERGEVESIAGTTRDVTERKRAEEARVRSEETARTRARQQQAVAEIGEYALAERDLQRVFDYATARIAQTLDVEYCKVLELLPDGDHVLLRSGVGWREGLVGTATVDTGLDSQAGYTLISPAPVIVADMRTEERFSGPALLIDHGVISGMSCVIHVPEAGKWGVLGTHSTRPVDFTSDDVNFLIAVANIIGSSVHRRRVEHALEEGNRRKDEFLAILGHELRNPMAAIRMATAVVRKTNSEATAAHGEGSSGLNMLDIIERQSSHLSRLIDDLLDLGRVSSGKITLRKQAIDLREAVAQVADGTSDARENKQLAISISQPNEPVFVHADPLRLSQVIGNLLSNACKFTEPGGKVTITVLRESGQAALRVRDTGRGIAAEDLPRIFEMFTQIEGKSRSESGLGIGLAVVKAIAELHGGTIEARSEGLGRGSEFTLRLPVTEAAETTAETTQAGDAAPDEASSDEARTRRRRVLAVDDNEDALNTVATMLRLSGHEVIVAADGATALEAAASHRPEVALLDIGMPEIDGYEVARRIRSEPWGRDMYLVAMTGWGQDRDKRDAMEAGFNAHLTKPVEPHVLARVLSLDADGAAALT